MSILKEPFLHFAVLGVAIFAWFALANPNPAVESDAHEIIVDEQIIRTLSLQFKAKMKRNPTPQEAKSLMDHFISNEVLVREAKALGMDEDDGVVRNRLAQKMTFLVSSAAQSAVPDDPTLQTHLQENAAQFETGAKVTFKQFGLAPDIDEAEIEKTRDQLQAGEQPEQHSAMQLLPDAMQRATKQQVDGTFGRGFFEALSSAPVRQWIGPVQSGYGYHLIQVDDLVSSQLPPLEDVRDKVLMDWRRALSGQLTEAHMQGLMERYEITRPSEEDLTDWATK